MRDIICRYTYFAAIPVIPLILVILLMLAPRELPGQSRPGGPGIEARDMAAFSFQKNQSMPSAAERSSGFTAQTQPAYPSEKSVHSHRPDKLPDPPPKRYSFDFRGVALEEVLEKLVRTTETDLIYDPGLVSGISIYQRISEMTMPELLGKTLEGTLLDYVTLSTGTVVIVKAVQDKPAFGSFSGKITDSQTGEPLPGAHVMLVDVSGGTSANRAGQFSLNRLISGSYNIVFSYVGYEPVFKTIHLRPEQELREEIRLNPRPGTISPIIVTDHLPQMSRTNGNYSWIRPGGEWDPPGSRSDVIRSLNLFSGVQYGLPMTDLHIQGGSKSEHRMQLDGVPVYHPYSFGQMFSAFSPFAVGKVEVHKAGYGVQQGSQIAGLINLKHDIGGGGRSWMLQGDPLSVNTRLDLGGSPKKKSPFRLMTAFRTNYWDLYRNPAVERTLREWDEVDPLIMSLLLDQPASAVYETHEHDSDLQFYDLHLVSRYDLDSYSSLSASFYAGKNFVSTDLLGKARHQTLNHAYMYARDQYQWNNLMGQLSWHTVLSPRMNLVTQASFTTSRLDHRYLIGTSRDPETPDFASDGIRASLDSYREISGSLPVQRDGNEIRHFILRSDGSYSISPKLSLDAGIQLDLVDSRVDFSDLFLLQTRSGEHSVLSGTYVHGNWRTGDYWKFGLGSRFTYKMTGGGVYPEPRASIQVDRPDKGIGYWSVRVSGGLYRQFINQFDITNAGPTAIVPSFPVWSHAGSSNIPKAWHLSSSFYLEPSENMNISFEIFRKWQPATYITSYNNLLTGYGMNRSQFEAFGESAEMNIRGGGIRLNRTLPQQNVQLMAGYDYSISRLEMISQFGRALPAPWNEPHRVQFRSLWHFLPDITLIAKWQSTLGRTWAFRQAYYDYFLFRSIEGSGDFTFTHPENDRLSPFHQLDISVMYKPSLSFARLELRLDLINALNRSNIIDWSLVPVRPGESENIPEAETEYEIRERKMPGFNPSLSVQLKF